jgi:Macro domain
MSIQPVLLVIAIASLLFGIGLFVWFSMPDREQHLQIANRIAWLLIALFPVCIIFSFFPTSTFSGTVIKGVTASGAIAAFFVIWLQGAHVGIKAAEKDSQTAKLKAQERQIAKLEEEARVHQAQIAPQVIDTTTTQLYKLRNVKNKSIGIVTGNLDKVKFADIWVNSENSKMEMAGFHDRSVSGAIRYYGARKDAAGNVMEDLIANALAEALHGSSSVAPGRVIWTSSGELAKTHKVRGILHAAAVQGQPGSGYRQIEDIGRCVTSALECLDERNEMEQPPFQTIIFPLLGAGQGQAKREVTARALLVAALDHLEAHRKCAITTVYFLAYTDAEQAAWNEVLRVCPERLTRV